MTAVANRKRRRGWFGEDLDAWITSEHGPLKTIPTFLYTRLTKLDCSKSMLTILPDSLDRLVSLEKLDCSWNALTSLPEWLGRLTFLKTLRCHCNMIAALPDWLGRCAFLKNLIFTGNRIEGLPLSLAESKSLRKVEFGGNWLRGDFRDFRDGYLRDGWSKLRTHMLRLIRMRLLLIGWRDPGSSLSALPIEMVHEIISHL